jgi:hypothetical protein
MLTFQFILLKKGRGKIWKNFLFTRFYGLFLNIPITTSTRTIMTKTNSPAIAGTKYMSATEVGVAGGGVAVGAGAIA